MRVELLASTPEPEKLIAAAAKLCYSKSGAGNLMEGLDEKTTENFIDKLVSLGHDSPLEHMSFSFAIEGVSRVLTHQLVRHRMASYSQQSQRYVKLDQFEYVLPPTIAAIPEAKVLFEEAMAQDQKTYDELVDILKEAAFRKFTEMGVSESRAKQQAEKSAIEDARYVFPNACETKIVVTMNARSLINFFEHRCCERAQWEIRALADEMLKLVKAQAPNVFKKAGPNCVKSTCSEGVMSCGKQAQMKEKYMTLNI